MIKKTLFWVLPFVLGLAFLLGYILFVYPSEVEAYNLDGDNVWWDNSYGKIVVWPHTSNQLISHTQYANITSYIGANIDLDFAFQFDNPLSKKKIWIWKNISHEGWELDYQNITYLKISGNNTCEYWGCFDQAELCNCTGTQQDGGHWNDNYYFDWKDVTPQFSHNEFNNSHFYWIKDVNFDTDETKQLKWQYDQPIEKSGKWGLWIKRSSDTIPEALENGMFINLDPWWDSVWAKKVNITVEETGGVARNNEMADVWLNYTVTNCTEEYRIIWNDTLELTSQVFNESYDSGTGFCTEANILFMVNLTANQRRNYTLYYNNSGATAPSYTDLVVSYDPTWIEQVQTPIYNVTNGEEDATSTKTISFINHSTSTLNGVSLSFNYLYDITNQWFNKSIKTDGVLMVESYPTFTSVSNTTIRIYPYYSEIDFNSDTSHTLTVVMNLRHGLSTSGADYAQGANYSFFGNSTLFDTNGLNADVLKIADYPIASGLNRTYVYSFFNISQEGFIAAFANITSYYNMMEDENSRYDQFLLGGSNGVYGEIEPTSFTVRVTMDRNFSSDGWRIARNERIKLENPLTYTLGDQQTESVEAFATDYNITKNNYMATTYETTASNFNITIFRNATYIDFIDARLVWDGENFGVDSNSTNDATNKTVYEKNHIADLVDVNSTSYNTYWNLTVYYWNGSIATRTSAVKAQDVDWAYIITSVSTAATNVWMGDNFIANATVTKTVDNATSSKLKFEFQNVNTSGTQLTDTSTEERWSGIVTSQSFSGNNQSSFNVTAYLNLTFNSISKERRAGINASVTLRKISFDACVNYSTLIINITSREADTREIINTDIKANFDMWKDNKSVKTSVSFEVEDVNTTGICLYPPWAEYVADAIIEYGNGTYVVRNYYLNNATITNVTTNITIFNLLNTRDTVFQVFVKDEFESPISNAYIKAQRYYVSSNAYETVAMAKTSADGDTILKLVANEPDYKFLIEKDLELKYISESQKVTCPEAPCTLTFYIKGVLDLLESLGTPSGVSYTLIFNNQTKIVEFTFSDVTGATQSGNLIVTQKSLGKDDNVICNSVVTSSSGTLTCNVSLYEGEFTAEARIVRSPADTLKIISFNIQKIANILRLKPDAMILGTILTLTIAGAGLWNPAVAIVLAIVGMIVGSSLGVFAIGWNVIISFVIVGVIILKYLRT